MAEIKIKADSNGGTVSLKGPASTTGNAAIQLTLPVDDGTANQYLKTDGSGALSWSTVSAGTTLTGSTDNTICTVTGANAIQGEAGLTYDGNDLYVKSSEGNDASIHLYSDEGDDNADKWRILNAQSTSNKLRIASYAGGSWADHLNIETGGDLEAVRGNLKFASGKGLDFSATGDGTIGGDGGGRSEVLDDYEYGRWTPTCKSDGTITSPYNCHYHKVGNRVWICGFIRQFSNDSSGNTITIEGLPFAVDGYEWLTKSKASGSCGTLYTDLACHQSYANGGDHIEFQASSSASWNTLKHSHLNHANHLIMFDCTYLTS